MRVLISGAGIAGPTLAYWLARYGYTPTLVERSPRLRTGGYVIDFWGTGYDVAERMGLTLDLEAAGYRVDEVRFVNAQGRRSGGMSIEVFRDITRGRYLSLPRGDLASTIYRNLNDGVETILGDSVTGITQSEGSVSVRFEKAAEREFDLVIGADGLHSTVRDLEFGPQDGFEKHLGYTVAAFEVSGYRPRDELVYLSYSRPGKQVSRIALRDDRTLIMFVYRTDTDSLEQGSAGNDIAARKAALHREFDDAGWECPQILEAMDAAPDLYIDRVSQIRMDGWSRGRVALVGDAAFCPSLLSGQGSALAMTAAYVLAGELKRAKGDHVQAFASYERMLKPFIAGKQQAAEKFAGAFAPKTAFGIYVRDKATSLLGIRFLAKAMIGKSMIDQFDLPDYGA